MNSFLAVFKRELKSYFATPLAYVFLVIFLAVAGYAMFRSGFYQIGQADLRTFFMNIPILLVFLVPAVAMRLWAEERKIGSVELLFTLPVTIVQAVVGKFLAAWVFLGIALGLTFPVVVTVAYLGSPDFGPIITGYLGAFLMAGSFLAVGCFFSAVSRNQVIAFVLSLLACAILLLIGMPTVLNYFSSSMSTGGLGATRGVGLSRLADAIVPSEGLAYRILLALAWITTIELIPLAAIFFCSSWVSRGFWFVVSLVLFWISVPASGTAEMIGLLEGMSIQIHFDSMQKGILQFKDVAYFGILIAGWIAACAVVLDERKAN